MDKFFATSYLSILNDGHLDEQTWETHVQPERFRMHSASYQSFERMNQLLSGAFEIGRLLRETYTVKTANGGPSPAPSCSGCPVCRADKVEGSQRFSHPEPDLVESIEHGSVAELQTLFRVQSPVVFVRVDSSYGDGERLAMCLDLIQKLAARGVDEFAVPEEWKSKRNWKRVHEFSPRRFVVASPLGSYDHVKNDLRLPRATFLFASAAPVIPKELINMERPFHIIFAAEDAIESGTGRKFFSTHHHVRDYDLIQRLGQ
jgi:hypothetical protein